MQSLYILHKSDNKLFLVCENPEARQKGPGRGQDRNGQTRSLKTPFVPLFCYQKKKDFNTPEALEIFVSISSLECSNFSHQSTSLKQLLDDFLISTNSTLFCNPSFSDVQFNKNTKQI